MKTHIIPVQNSVLKEYIQYFLFFEHSGSIDFSYVTFPNTNLCLTVYKQNKVVYKHNQQENICTIDEGSTTFSSRLIGFHSTPFNVEIKSALDQLCILFHPGGLRAFTRAPYQDLADESKVFELLFHDNNIIDQVFETIAPHRKALLLEIFLLNHLMPSDIPVGVIAALSSINDKNGNITINKLANNLKLHTSTLYRQFNSYVGQSPKDFIQTVRFRYALTNMVRGRYLNLSELSYQTNFYDQSHFIKDCKKRSGNLPRALHKSIKIEQKELAWIITIN